MKLTPTASRQRSTGRVETITKSVKQSKVGDSVLILSERQESVAAAQELAKEMKAAGVNDLFVFGKGESAPASYRWAFTIPTERSRTAPARFARAGLRDRHECHRRGTQTAYWLDVELRADPNAVAFVTDDPALAEVSIEPTSCEKIVAQND